MNADDLRAVAAEIRELAGRTLDQNSPVKWPRQAFKVYDEVFSLALPYADDQHESTYDVRIRREEALHIMAWSPPVALAVADWLDETAEDWRLDVKPQSTEDAAAAFVKAWRGEPS